MCTAPLARLRGDLAGSPFPHALPGLLGIAPADQFLYGHATPLSPPPIVQAAPAPMLETDLLDDSDKSAVFCENAQPPFARPGQSAVKFDHWRGGGATAAPSRSGFGP